MLYVKGDGLSRGQGCISHAFIQSCELTLVRILCPSHAEKKPNGEGNNKSIKTKIFQNYLLAYGVKIRCLGPP